MRGAAAPDTYGCSLDTNGCSPGHLRLHPCYPWPQVREALSALIGALQPALCARLGADAQLHELAALVSLPGAARQPVHPDTPMSFFEEVGEGAAVEQGPGKGEGEGKAEGKAEGQGKGAGAGVGAGRGEWDEQQPSIVTAFCALQDIGSEMGPTLFLPRTHTAAAHADFYTYANFDLACSSVESDVGAPPRSPLHGAKLASPAPEAAPGCPRLWPASASLGQPRAPLSAACAARAGLLRCSMDTYAAAWTPTAAAFLPCIGRVSDAGLQLIT